MNQMQVYLDDTPCDVDCQSLAHAIADAAAQAEQAGRLIVEVMVDGQSWTQQQLSGEDMTQATANEVRMTSVDPAQLIGETVTHARAALDQIDAIQREAAELLQQDEHREAMGKLEEAISIWMNIQDAAAKCAEMLHIELADLASEYVDPNQAMQTLTEKLGQVRQALLDDDTVTLSDTLLYELPDVVDQWKSLLSALADRAIDGRIKS